MEYGREYAATVTPVELLEAPEGLQKVTTFEEITSYTLRALLKGYKCTDQMLDRLEYESSIVSNMYTPIEFFVTDNPHSFAACITNSVKSIQVNKYTNILYQNEILDLVESLTGSLKRPGNSISLKRRKGRMIYLKKFNYESPIYDMSLRYLSLSKYTEIIDEIKLERFLLVLYLPKENK